MHEKVDDWFRRLHVKRNTHIYPEKSCSHPQFGSIWVSKLETDDGNSFGNLHASRKLKVIFLVALKSASVRCVRCREVSKSGPILLLHILRLPLSAKLTYFVLSVSLPNPTFQIPHSHQTQKYPFLHFHLIIFSAHPLPHIRFKYIGIS